MRKRAGLILKIGCYVLAALVIYQLASRVARWRRVSVTIPELPTLSDAQAKGTNTATASAKGTNAVITAAGTNVVSSTNLAGTNAAKSLVQSETNSAPRTGEVKTNITVAANPRPEPEKDIVPSTPVSPEKSSNRVQVVSGTNIQAMLAAGTNSSAPRPSEP